MHGEALEQCRLFVEVVEEVAGVALKDNGRGLKRLSVEGMTSVVNSGE